MQPTPVFLPGKSHELRSLASYSPWGRKGLNMTERTHTQPPLRLSPHKGRSHVLFMFESPNLAKPSIQ